MVLPLFEQTSYRSAVCFDETSDSVLEKNMTGSCQMNIERIMILRKK